MPPWLVFGFTPPIVRTVPRMTMASEPQASLPSNR